MKTELVEDKVIAEIPVYLSKSDTGKVHVFQYPVRPRTNTYDDDNILKAQIKPVSSQIEIEIGLETRAATYDHGKGEQIAMNVDGALRDKLSTEDNFYEGTSMDKVVLTSSTPVTDTRRYAVGVFNKEAGLHLSPVSSIFAMKPSFNYLDLADKRSKMDSKEQTSDTEPDEGARKVTVRFERPETDRIRETKEKSYNFLQKKIREEPWQVLAHHRFGSERSEFDSRHLYCSKTEEMVDQFTLDKKTYLQTLIFGTPVSPSVAEKKLNSNQVPLQEKVKKLILNTTVVSLEELVSALDISDTGSEESPSAVILKAVQQVAVLVQGNWVVKSDIVYPKDSRSDKSMSNEGLQRLRDCILYMFTKARVITRDSICALIGSPMPELTKMLQSVASSTGQRGSWEFELPTDHAFDKKYPDVAQRQQMIWKSRYEQLSQYFNK